MKEAEKVLPIDLYGLPEFDIHAWNSWNRPRQDYQSYFITVVDGRTVASLSNFGEEGLLTL